jgi:K+-transporting ATPase ATPase C chain
MALGTMPYPYINLTDAMGQINRIAETRNLSPDEKIRLAELVGQHIEVPQWNIFGGPRINVIELNAAIDSMFGKSAN